MSLLQRILYLFLVSALFVGCSFDDSTEEKKQKPKVVPIYTFGIKTNNFTVIDTVVPKHSTFASLFTNHGLSQNIAQTLIQKGDSLFDVRKLRSGNRYVVFLDKKTAKFCCLVYEIDKINHIIFDLRDTSILNVYLSSKKVEIRERKVRGKIETSLWNTMESINVDGSLAVELSEMFASSIDFFNIQKDDEFAVIFDEQSIEGEPSVVQQIKCAEFKHEGKVYFAIPFIGKDGKRVFYDEHGNGTKKAFLKAPLKFARVTSGFSHARRHPVLRIVRPHHGVDYGAPTGTPVMSIGHGVVLSKGYSGGAGNMVKIKHQQGYVSSYMHLSRFGGGVSVGSRVTQGQIIGYVGSTGLSTGPHLDFRIYHNNKPVNPLKIVSPPSEPISGSYKKQFNIVRDSLVGVLKGIK